MKTKNQTEALDEQIAMLEARQSYEMKLLKDQFHETYDSLKPINLIKSALSDVTSSPIIKGTVVSNVIGLAAEYLSKKVLMGVNHSPVRNILGGLLKFAISNFVTKKSNQFTSNQLN